MQEQHDALLDLYALGNIAEETRATLWTYLRDREPVPTEQQGPLSLTFGHLDEVREGFQITLRAANVTTAAEMRYLVNRIWLNWDWLQDLGLELLPEEQVSQVGRQALAFAHTLIALGLLPRMPAGRVTFPGRPTYADISVPHSPAEILLRIDELESVLFDATLKPVGAIEPEPLRRTYGFFETSAWLVFDHLRKFLGG